MSPETAPDKETMTNDYDESKGKTERGHSARAGQQRGERRSRKREDGHGNTRGVDGREARAPGSVSEEVQAPVETEKAASNAGNPYPKPRSEFDSTGTPPVSVPRQEISTEPFVPTLAEISADVSPSVGKKESFRSCSRPRGIDEEAQEELVGEGFHVSAEPPDDMMAFLRGMSWWEEGLF